MKAELRSSTESADRDPKQEHVRRQLSVGFLVYRNLISQHLLDNPKKKVTKEAMEEIHRSFSSYWHDMFDPAVVEGMSGVADEQFVKAAAGKYSGDLAKQVNEISDKAFIEGYNAAVNKGWERAVAWQRISTTYGVDPAQMRSWVTYYPADGYHPEEVPRKSAETSDKMLYERAERISKHEAWSLKQLGKQAQWTQQMSKGELPATTQKIWVTANDELVCPTCAPMDNIMIGINQQFKTSTGKFFAPPVHINCRCEIYLQFEPVAKAMGNDRFNRDVKGRFSSIEQRTGKRNPALKIAGRGPARKKQEEVITQPKALDQIMYRAPAKQEAKAESKKEAKPEAKQEVKTEVKQEVKTEEKKDTRPRRQAQQNVSYLSKLGVNAKDDVVLEAAHLGDTSDLSKPEDDPQEGDTVIATLNLVLEGTRLDEVSSTADAIVSQRRNEEPEIGRSQPVTFYLVDAKEDARYRQEHGLGADDEIEYEIKQVVASEAGAAIPIDFANDIGLAPEDISHSHNSSVEDKTEVINPTTIVLNRLTPK